MLVTNSFYTIFPLSENTTSHPPGHHNQPQMVQTKDDFCSSSLLTTCCFPPSSSPGATRTRSIFPPPSARYAEFSKRNQINNVSLSSASGISPKPLHIRHKNQKVYISPTTVSSYLHLPRYESPTCFPQVNELSVCHFFPQLSTNHQLHYTDK